MALSEKEKEWLERRKILCTHCDLIARGICKGEKGKTSCPRWEDYHCTNPVKGYKAFQDMQDAAEFEARVVAALSSIDGRCLWTKCKGYAQGCYFCRLYYARLAAEAEMNK